MNSDFIKLRLLDYYNTPTDILIPNYYVGGYEADVYKISKAGITTEFEIKISKSDFKVDFSKGFIKYDGTTINKHDLISQGKRTNKFYFVVPEGLILKEEVPEYAGLIYCTKEGYLKVIKNSKLLHKGSHFEKDPNLYEKLLGNLLFRERNASRALRNAKNYIKELENKLHGKNN